MVTQKISELIVWIMANQDMIALLFVVGPVLYDAYKQRKNAKDTIYLLFNTLKDEKKMADGVAFSEDTVAKAKEMGRLMGMDANAIQTVINEISATQTTVQTGQALIVPPTPTVGNASVAVADAVLSGLMPNGVKIGSKNGKPIYLPPSLLGGILSRLIRT